MLRSFWFLVGFILFGSLAFVLSSCDSADYGEGISLKESTTAAVDLPADYMQVTVTATGEIREIDLNSEYYRKFVLRIRCDQVEYKIGAQLIERQKGSPEQDLLVACVKKAVPEPVEDAG